MKSNKKLVYICSIIIILGGSYLFISGKFNFTKSETPKPAKTQAVTVQPIISNILVKNITAVQAMITWETNIPTTSQLIYGTSKTLDTVANTSAGGDAQFSTLTNNSSATRHTIFVRNLKAKTEYFYKIISTDKNKNQITSDITSFTTLDTHTTVAPRRTVNNYHNTNYSNNGNTSNKPITITSSSAKNITTTSAEISWKTNVAGTSQVFYGTDSSYTGTYPLSSTLDSNLVLTHDVSLVGLSANQKIYYQVVSVDKNGVKAVSKESSFKVATVSVSGSPTLDFKANGGVENVSVSWKTNVPTRSQVLYGDTTSTIGTYGHQTNLDTNLNLLHTVALNNLMGNIKFYYRIVNIDNAGVKTFSNEYSFTTSAANYIVAKDINRNSVTITWNTPIPATGKITFGTVSGTYPMSTALYSGLSTSHTVTINTLQPATKYYFQIISGGAGIIGTKSDEFSFSTLN